VKVVWCGGRPAKLVKYFYSKWMCASEYPVQVPNGYACGYVPPAEYLRHGDVRIFLARPGRRLFGLAECATYHKMSTVLRTSYVATPTYYRILSTLSIRDRLSVRAHGPFS